MRSLRLISTAVFIALLGCAIPVQQLKLPQPIALLTGKHFVLNEAAHCNISTGYSRILRQGTHWDLFGAITQGEVYRSPDQTLTVEGYNVHEAYVVINNGTLVGFYLPVEKTFTPVSKQVRLSLAQS